MRALSSAFRDSLFSYTSGVIYVAIRVCIVKKLKFSSLVVARLLNMILYSPAHLQLFLSLSDSFVDTGPLGTLGEHHDDRWLWPVDEVGGALQKPVLELARTPEGHVLVYDLGKN